MLFLSYCRSRLPERHRHNKYGAQARWALKLCGVEYRTVPYTPLLGTWWLRWQTGLWNGRVTTPVLMCCDKGMDFPSTGLRSM